ncbi:MAG: hypothetical protein LBV29_05785 [Azoarcus sp.]|jgi:hypothetical protein|nr:hypothetical protein [Azoarcus sp.]
MSFEDGLIRGGVQAAEDSATQTQSDALKSMTALNYCTFSLSKIKEYNDRVVLDEEYNNIINSISLKNIPDQKIVGIIKQLMDTLTAFRLSEMEKEKLFKEYENSQQTAVMTMLMEMASPSISAAGNVAGNMVSTVISAVGYKGAAVGMFGASTLAMLGAPVAATVAATAGVVAIPVLFVAGHSVYSEHQRRHREQIKKHNEKLDDHTWTMSKYAIRAINELNKSFLETYWPILQDSDAPENWRVTSDQVTMPCGRIGFFCGFQ